jgi:EAL domain-containing protein (putative c-di-GMP-specific phosphodiesterase class I)/putative methionine-R-sulfoxide reductase with GAF domain
MSQIACKPGIAHNAEEESRLTALRALEILDTQPEPCFDTIVRMAANYMQTETAYLAFVDETRVWVKSTYGITLREFPRRDSICDRVIQERKTKICLDFEDQTSVSRLARAMGTQFFVGVPVREAGGQAVGVLCMCSSHPRDRISEEELEFLEEMATLVADHLELRQLRGASTTLDDKRDKHRGPVTYPPEMATEATWPQAEDLRHALRRNQFVLHYQPEVELATRRIVGVEALIRWQHPKRGLLPPLDFIPQAEEHGVILSMGDWGLGQACRQMQKWQNRWPSLSAMRVCVNLSAHQFSRAGLADHVESLLLATGLCGNQLGLEMTESCLISDVAETTKILTSLNRLGVSLHMDDFGTGYSSLNHLHQFPFDVLKIDRSFVQRMNAGQQPLQIVQTILDLARVLRMDVVAEGIETEEQLQMLREMGCRYGQGYLFSRPLPAAGVETLLARTDELFQFSGH